MSLPLHTISCENYLAIACRKDRTWGHAIDVEVFQLSGEKFCSLTFACHPEFDEFKFYQEMSTEALLSVVALRLETIVVTNMDVWISGFRLYVRFNGMVATEPAVRVGR